MGKDVIVNEEELSRAADKLVNQSNTIEQDICQYLAILNAVKDNAVIEGDFSEALKEYAKYARKLQNQSRIIAQKAKAKTIEFISVIDDDDKYLY